MYALGRYLLGAFALVVAVSSADCSPDDGTCSSLPVSAQASALLQVERSSMVKGVASHKHNQDANAATLGFTRLAARAAADGFCTNHPCTMSLLDNSPTFMEKKSGVGKSAALSQSGYEQVVAAKDDMEMKDFILRVIDKYDCKVESIGGLMGIVPWFSGTTLAQDLEKLENTLLYAVLSSGKKASWLSYKNSDHITGDSAALDFVGYVQVAAIKNDDEMKKYVRRVCRDKGIKVVDEDGLSGMVRFYSGTDNFQSFDRLMEEVKSAADAPHSWAEWEKGKPPSKGTKGFSMLALRQGAKGFSMLALRAERGFCKDFPCRVTYQNSASFLQQQGASESAPSGESHGHDDRETHGSGLGKSVALDQGGYAKVAALKDDAQMIEFIKRVIDKYDCKVEHESGLAGIVPWFSGSTTTQSLEALENTVLYAVLTMTKNPWLKYKNSANIKGDNAELNFVGYVQIAALRDDLQMQDFARRVCDKMGVKVVNKDGFAGMVRYYSGTDNFQSYDKLQQEIRSAANAPNSWALIEDKAKYAKENPTPAPPKREERHEELQKAPAQAPAEDPTTIGATAELNYAGYVQVASSRKNEEMAKFARRVCQKLNVKITDEGGFSGMVRFFVGPDNFQSYDKMQTDIKLAASKPKSWCKYQ